MDGNRNQHLDIPTTTSGSATEQFSENEWLARYLQIVKYADLVIFPTIGIVGLVGNALSGVIVVKDGLHKPSNILLLGLAVADFAMLLDTINIARLMTYASRLEQMWIMDFDSIVICYNLTMTTVFISTLASGISTTLTVSITLERIVAVFFPLKFSRLVTPARANIVVIISFVLAAPFAIIAQFRYRLFTIYMEMYGGWIGFLSEQGNWTGSGMEHYVFIVFTYVIPVIPTTVVTFGCVLIGVKVSLTMRRRKEMTSNTGNKNSSARTVTLFMICCFFSIKQITKFFSYLPQLRFTRASNGPLMWYYVSLIYVNVTNFLGLCNSACNFFIYVIFNPKFRKLIIQTFCNIQSKK